MHRVLLVGLLAMGCGSSPPPAGGPEAVAPGLLLLQPERLQLPDVPTEAPELLRAFSFDDPTAWSGALGTPGPGPGVAVAPGAGRSGAGLRVVGQAERAAATVELGIPGGGRRCSVEWAWRVEGPVPAPHRAARMVVEELPEVGAGDPAALALHRSSAGAAASTDWTEERVEFVPRRASRRLWLALHGPAQRDDADGVSAVLYDDVRVVCDTLPVSVYARAPQVHAVPADLPVRRVTAGRADRPAILLPTPARWSFRVDRSRPHTLRTAVALAAPTAEGVQACVVVSVDGEDAARSCRGGDGRKRRGWLELAVPVFAEPGRVSTVELRAEARPGADGTQTAAWVAWSEPRLQPEGPAPAPDILVVLLRGLSQQALEDHAAVLPTVSQLGTSGTRYTQARTASGDTRAAVASVLTGQAPEVHGARGRGRRGIADGVVTLAQDLRERGFDTAFFPSSPALRTGLERGFSHVQRAAGEAASRVDAAEAHVHDARAIRGLKRRWVEERVAGRAHFAVLELSGAALPHHLERARLVMDQFGFGIDDLPRAAQRLLSLGRGLHLSRPRKGWAPDPALLALGHRAELRRVDAQLKSLLTGDLERAHVIVSGLPGAAARTSALSALAEDAVHVPILVHAPGVSDPGRVVEHPVLSSVIADHVRALAGMEGAPLPSDREPQEAPALQVVSNVGQGADGVAVVRDGRWKLVLRPPWLRVADGALRAHQVAVFDVRSDPGEAVPVPWEQVPDAESLQRAAERWMRTGLPGLHLRCPAGEGPRELRWDGAPKGLRPMAGEIELLPDGTGLRVSGSPQEAEGIWVVFPPETVLTVPEACALETIGGDGEVASRAP